MKFYIASATVLVLSAIMTMTSTAALPAAANVLAANVDEVPRCCVYNGQEICDGPYCAVRAKEALAANVNKVPAAVPLTVNSNAARLLEDALLEYDPFNENGR